jgi:hypothetical protein
VSEEPEETVEVLEAELSVARMSGLDDEIAGAAVSDDELDAMIRELAQEEDAQARAAAERAAAAPTEEGPADVDVAEAVGPEPDALSAQVAPPPEPPEDEAPEAEMPEPPADTEPGAAEGPPVESGGPGPAGAAGTPPARRDALPPPPAPPRPQTDGERWGVRLPRSRRPAAGVATAPPAPAPSGDPAHTASGAAVAPEPAADEGESGPYVDELFARIRAERADRAEAPETTPRPAPEAGAVAVAVRPEPADAAAPLVGAEAGADDGTVPADPVAATLQGRDAVLAGVERELGRRLKRALADEQNEVLDMLRRGGTIEFDVVVPAVDEHADRYAIAAQPDLDAAAAHGAVLTAPADAGGAGVPSCDEMAGELGRSLVEPLRVRIRRSFDDCDGDLEEVTERLRALYREWKGQHIGEAVRHYAAAAYSQGAYRAAPAGLKFRWLVDPSCEACPDCDDNALAGALAKDEAYPTGNRCAPAHTDCRCLVVPVTVLEGAPG